MYELARAIVAAGDTFYVRRVLQRLGRGEITLCDARGALWRVMVTSQFRSFVELQFGKLSFELTDYVRRHVPQPERAFALYGHLQRSHVGQNPAVICRTVMGAKKPLRAAFGHHVYHAGDPTNGGVVQRFEVWNAIGTGKLSIATGLGGRMDGAPAANTALPRAVLDVFALVRNRVYPTRPPSRKRGAGLSSCRREQGSNRARLRARLNSVRPSIPFSISLDRLLRLSESAAETKPPEKRPASHSVQAQQPSGLMPRPVPLR